LNSVTKNFFMNSTLFNFFKISGLTSFLMVILIASGCSSKKKQADLVAQTGYQPEYAVFYRIDYYDGYKKLTIINPWGNTSLNLEYFILQDSNAKPPITPGNLSFVVNQNPQKIAALASPFVGLINILQLENHLVGVTDPELIYDAATIHKVENGAIENIGKSIQLNMEKLLQLQPNLVIGSGWEQLSSDYERLIQYKLTPLLMYDWQEHHPLGKAEWMIALAAFYNQEEQAIAEFRAICNRYHSLKQNTDHTLQPVVFNGSEYEGIWYSAGGKSYKSQLYQDAGGKYLLQSDSSEGSIQLDFEVIMHKAAQADIWMYTGAIDPQNLRVFSTAKYGTFKAIKNHRVYSYHKRLNSQLANDYWETGSYRPDVVLRDLIKIFHEEQPTDLYYFSQVDY